MLKIDYWFLDAFTHVPFKGNPTVVIVTEQMLDTSLMQQLAIEFNLSETVFVSDIKGIEADLKWFTPSHEVQLCGHGTLSAAHILFEQGFIEADEVRLQTLSGELTAVRDNGQIELTFPRIQTNIKPVPEGLSQAVGSRVIGFAETQANDGYWVAQVDCHDLSQLKIDLEAFKNLSDGSLIVTSSVAVEEVVLRYFAPNHGVDEDPVTGSANVVLADFWQQISGWSQFSSMQQSKRTGTMQVRCLEQQVKVVGSAVTLANGTICLK